MKELERSQTQTPADSIHLKCPAWANPETDADRWLPGARGGEDEEWPLHRHGGSVWGDEKVLELDRGDGCTTT